MTDVAKRLLAQHEVGKHIRWQEETSEWNPLVKLWKMSIDISPEFLEAIAEENIQIVADAIAVEILAKKEELAKEASNAKV